jgi:hypothetical protein
MGSFDPSLCPPREWSPQRSGGLQCLPILNSEKTRPAILDPES